MLPQAADDDERDGQEVRTSLDGKMEDDEEEKEDKDNDDDDDDEDEGEDEGEDDDRGDHGGDPDVTSTAVVQEANRRSDSAEMVEVGRAQSITISDEGESCLRDAILREGEHTRRIDRFAGSRGRKLPSGVRLAGLADAAAVHGWALDVGVLTVSTDSCILPSAEVTRGQAAEALMRFCTCIEQAQGRCEIGTGLAGGFLPCYTGSKTK